MFDINSFIIKYLLSFLPCVLWYQILRYSREKENYVFTFVCVSQY